MPIYEYRCQECRRRFSVFWRSFSKVEKGDVVCKHCSSPHVKRLVSRIRVLRSEENIASDMTDPSTWGNFDEDDPKSLGRFMRKMANQMGEEADELGSDFEEVMDRLETGQSPENIEKEMPDLQGNTDGGTDIA